MLKLLIKTLTVYSVISAVSLARIDDRHGRSVKGDSPLVSLPSKEVDVTSQQLLNSIAEKDQHKIKVEASVPNPEKSSLSGSDDRKMRGNFGSRASSLNKQNHTYGYGASPNKQNQTYGYGASPNKQNQTYGYGASPNKQNQTYGYGAVSKKEEKAKYCIWYDHKKQKEQEKADGSRWSGNGCKTLQCKNGVIIPDPSCCEIETTLHGFISHYFLYQNHGQKWIKACELLTCDSGLIKKVKKIPGCCVYDYVHSKEDGESWWAFSASTSDNNFCKKGTCNNGSIEIIQIKEGEVWKDGCFNNICKGSDFKMNKVNLAGECTIKGGKCINNGGSVKFWKQCTGVTCVNGKLFKRALKECSVK